MGIIRCGSGSSSKYAPEKTPFVGSGSSSAYPGSTEVKPTNFLQTYPDYTPFDNGGKYRIVKGGTYRFLLKGYQYNESGRRYNVTLYVYNEDGTVVDSLSVTYLGVDLNWHSTTKDITVSDNAYIDIGFIRTSGGTSDAVSAQVEINPV